MCKSIILFLFLTLFPLHALFPQKGGEVFESNGLYGLKGVDEEILIQPNYQHLGWSDGATNVGENVIGYHEGNWGLMTLKGRKLTKPVYYDLRMVDEGLIIAGIKGKFSNRVFYGILNTRGKILLRFNYANISYNEGLFVVTEIKDGIRYYGLFNKDRSFLLNPNYLGIRPFAQNLFAVTNTKGKIGLVDNKGDIILDFTTDNISEIRENYAIITISGKNGLINADGQIELEPIYKHISQEHFGKERILLEQYDSWKIITSNNTVLAEFSCDSIISTSHNYLIYRNDHIQIMDNKFSILLEGNGLNISQVLGDKVVLTKSDKWGVLGKDGVFIDYQYDSMYSDTSYFYALEQNHWTVYNKFGRKITKKKYEGVKPASESLIAVKRNGYWGFIDFQGDEAIDFKYDYVEPFYQRQAKVRFLNSYGTIDHFGTWICEPVYDEVDITPYGLTKASIKSRTDLLNAAGNVVFQTYNQLELNELGFLELTSEGQKGIIADYGGIVLYPIFNKISGLINNKLISVNQSGRVGALNKSGKWYVLPTYEYQDIYDIGEGLLAVKKDNSHGFIDLHGLLRIANRYDSVQRFNENYAPVQLRERWGFIDKREQLKIQPHFDSVEPFKNARSIVRQKGNYGVIDKSGKYVLPAEYDMIYREKSGHFRVQKDDRYGLYDFNGNRIVSSRFQMLERTESKMYIASSRNKYGLLKTNGLYAIPQIYHRITSTGKGAYFCITQLEGISHELP